MQLLTGIIASVRGPVIDFSNEETPSDSEVGCGSPDALAVFCIVTQACSLHACSVVTASCQGFVSAGRLTKRVLRVPCLAARIRFGLTNPHFDKILSACRCWGKGREGDLGDFSFVRCV